MSKFFKLAMEEIAEAKPKAKQRISARSMAPAAAVGAGLALSSQDAEAGLYNTGASFVRRNADVTTRDMSQERGSNRGERNLANRTTLSETEKSAIRKSIEGKNVTEQAAYDVAREWKKRHPSSDWDVPEITGMTVGDKGQLKLKTRGTAYGYNKDPATGKQISVGSPQYQRIVDNVFNEITDIARRAKEGDPDAQRVMDNAGWYQNVERRLRTEYGTFSQMMGDILGATSPNTPVGTNFKFSQDILNRATRGDFDELMDGFADKLDRRYALQDDAASYLEAQREAGRSKKDAANDPEYVRMQEEAAAISRSLQAQENTIKQSSVDPKTGQPKNYGINSYNAMIALADRWRVLREGGAPKARNFSGNLTGRSQQATIDVWAARNLRRHSGRKPIPSSAEGSVTGNIVDAENFRNSLEFGFGQDVLADATERLNQELGLSLDPRDVQALQWFAEKDHWTKNGWTSATGEGGSFETMMDADPVESMFLGISREQNQEFQGNDFVPTPAQSESTAQQIVSQGRQDPDVRAVKGAPTLGAYMDTPETAMDIDVVSTQDTLPTSILDAAAKQAVEDKQDSWFVARRVDEQVSANSPEMFNVGSEVYFKDGVDADDRLITDIQKDLNEQGIPAYTMIVDPRDPDRVVGLRFLDVPQFVDAEKFGNMSPDEYRNHVSATLGQFDAVGRNLKSKYPQIQAAQPSLFDVNVKSGEQTKDYVAQLQGEKRDPDVLHQEFYGFKPATTRFREFSGEVRPYYQGLREEPSANQKAAKGLTAAGLLTLGANANALGPFPDYATPSAGERFQQGVLGGADFMANMGSAVVAPFVQGVQHFNAMGRPTADGSTQSLEALQAQQNELGQMLNYSPRTELGQQYTDQFKGILAEGIQAVAPEVRKAHEGLYDMDGLNIYRPAVDGLGALHDFYKSLGDKSKMHVDALMNISPY